MTDLPADRYIEEALRRGKVSSSLLDIVKKHPESHAFIIELARMFERYEPTLEPVDPDLLIAKEAVQDVVTNPMQYKAGPSFETDCALRAIKLAREKEVL